MAKNSIGKPFLKWAGGKTQLIDILLSQFPSNPIQNYIEPFIGSGAMAFYILSHYPSINVIINDINSDLINVYRALQADVRELIMQLKQLESKYLSYNFDDKKRFFYDIRTEYNHRNNSYLNVSYRHAAYFIFLNKTCFNGLYRVNSHNGFNVPFGKYDNPCICNENLLQTNSQLLQRVIILNTDYSATLDYATQDGKTLYYFDPPYKPISSTAKFNSYTVNNFNDSQQIRLKEFCDYLTNHDIKFLLSNSDPKSLNSENNFFDELYKDYKISRIDAKRNINAKGDGRGKIKELLISNY